MNHEANRERLKNYADRTGHKVEYNDGGVMGGCMEVNGIIVKFSIDSSNLMCFANFMPSHHYLL